MSDIAVFPRKLGCRAITVAAIVQLLVLTAWSFPFQGKNGNTPKPEKTDSRHVIDSLENKWREAVLTCNANILDTLLAEDYVGIKANGTLQTKDQFLASARSGNWHITDFEVSDRKVRFYGRTALVTSLVRVEGATEDGPVTGTYRYTRVYARDTRGSWKVVNFEATRFGHPHEPKNGPPPKNNPY
jgi:ketosteroid isomerase-like protein